PSASEVTGWRTVRRPGGSARTPPNASALERARRAGHHGGTSTRGTVGAGADRGIGLGRGYRLVPGEARTHRDAAAVPGERAIPAGVDHAALQVDVHRPAGGR